VAHTANDITKLQLDLFQKILSRTFTSFLPLLKQPDSVSFSFGSPFFFLFLFFFAIKDLNRGHNNAISFFLWECYLSTLIFSFAKRIATNGGRG
jgi:hypothetical protein